jgi:hypothetical protein
MENWPVGAEVFRAEEQTEWRTDRHRDVRTHMTKLIVASRKFVKAPKNELENQCLKIFERFWRVRTWLKLAKKFLLILENRYTTSLQKLYTDQ